MEILPAEEKRKIYIYPINNTENLIDQVQFEDNIARNSIILF